VLELLGIAAALGSLVAVGAAPLVLRDALIRRAWRRCAEALGLELKAGSMSGGDMLKGTMRGFPVEIDNERRQRTRFAVNGTGRIDAELWLKRAGFTLIDRAGVIATGDRTFDRSFLVRGPRHIVLPLFDMRARAMIEEVFDLHEIEVRGGNIRHTTASVIQRADEMKDVLGDLFRVANVLELSMPLVDKLRLNATAAGEPARFRIANLEIMIEHFPRAPGTTTACKAAIASSNVDERLLAAIGLRDDPLAIGALEGIACLETAPASTRNHALIELSHLGADPEIERAATACASSRDPEVSAQAVRTLAKHRLPSARRVLLEVLALFAQDPPPLVAAAESIGSITEPHDPEVEAALVSLLRAEAVAVRIAAVHALGDLGTLRAVEPLTTFAKDFFADLDLKRAAKKAILDIQTRHPEAEGGRLSLATGVEDGELSLTEEEGGNLSIPREKTS
jgi:hypothetical protein